MNAKATNCKKNNTGQDHPMRRKTTVYSEHTIVNKSLVDDILIRFISNIHWLFFFLESGVLCTLAHEFSPGANF